MSGHKIALLKLAAYYEKILTDEQLEIYAEQLATSLTVVESQEAVMKYISHPENEFFPRPVSKLISLIKDPLDNSSKAQQVVSEIRNAILKKGSAWVDGYYWGKHPDSGEDVFYFEGKQNSFWTWKEAAIEYFGESGLAVVDHLGGWQRLCLAFDESPDTVINAQLLRAAEAVMAIYRHGRENQLPQLRSENRIQVMNLVSMREIPK